jgi:D-sedoheptulose 7-phosphate isomerase
MSESRLFTAYQNHSDALEQSLAINAGRIECYAKTLADSFAAGQRLLIVASGSLAGVASTLANAFLYRLDMERPSLPVVALSHFDGLAMLLSANDDVEQIFSCQLQAQANEADHVLFLVSSASPALVNAHKRAIDIGCSTAVICIGAESSWKKEDSAVLIPLMAPSSARGIEAALFFGHMLCELVEAELFGL